MNPIWKSVATWLLHSAASGGLVLLVTWLAVSGLRQPALRQRLGECGLLTAFLAAALCLLPAWLIVTYDAPPDEQAAATASPQPKADTKKTEPAPETPGAAAAPRFRFEGNDEIDVPWVVFDFRAGEEVKAPATAAHEVKPEGKTSAATLDNAPAADAGRWNGLLALAIQLLVIGYGVGLGWSVLRLTLAIVSLRRLARASVPASAGLVAMLRRIVDSPRLPRLRLSPSLRTPLSFGLFRPTIVLPAPIVADLDADRLTWVLRHEWTHLRRRDAWGSLLCALIRAVYFYAPWAWALCRQLRLCQEYIADAAAVEAEGRRVDYAEFLLALTRTAAPPLLATGVLGQCSDLYRRVTMLLERPIRVQPHFKKRWLLVPATALVALGVVVSGLGLEPRASAREAMTLANPDQANSPAPAAKTPAKDQQPAQPGNIDPLQGIQIQPGAGFPMAPPPIIIGGGNGQGIGSPFQMPGQGFEELQKVLKKMQNAKTPEEIQALQQELMKAVQAFQPNIGGNFNNLPNPPFGVNLGGGLFGSKSRLGASLSPPNKVVTEQLNLSAGQGLVVGNVSPGSAADKAGLKANDILLKFDGKAVPSNVQVFLNSLQQVKADAPVDAVILRKGKEQTIKGISLPKQAAQPANPFGGIGGFGPGIPGGGAIGPGFPGQIQIGGFGQGGMGIFGPGGVQMNIMRTNDKFNCRYQEGNLVITVNGSVDQNNKTQVDLINIQDGGQAQEYKSLKDVPAQYQQKVNYAVEAASKGSVQIQIQGN